MDFEVTDLPPSDHPEVGETAPDFERPLVNAEYWEDVALSELLAAGPVLLVFHPMDGAFPTTYVWNELEGRDLAGVQTVGLSVSTPYEHVRTIEERGLDERDVRLFSDPANDVAEAYGVTNDLDGMAGVTEARPAVFLIEEDATVAYAWAANEWPDFPDYDAIEDAVAAL